MCNPCLPKCVTYVSLLNSPQGQSPLLQVFRFH